MRESKRMIARDRNGMHLFWIYHSLDGIFIWNDNGNLGNLLCATIQDGTHAALYEALRYRTPYQQIQNPAPYQQEYCNESAEQQRCRIDLKIRISISRLRTERIIRRTTTDGLQNLDRR